MTTSAWGLTFRRGEADDRPLALVLAAGAGAAAMLAPLLPAVAPLIPACPFHALTDLPCPGCGTTRAVLALVRGDVAGALAWNPLVTLALLAGFTTCALAPLWIGARGPVPRLSAVLPARARWALVTALALNWAYLIVRGV